MGRVDGDLFWLVHLILKTTLQGKSFILILLMIKLKHRVVDGDPDSNREELSTCQLQKLFPSHHSL